MDDFKFRTSTQRVIYHRKVMHTQDGKQKGFDGELVQARVVERNILVGTMPDFW